MGINNPKFKQFTSCCRVAASFLHVRG